MIKKEKSKATQGIYLRCLRAILNAAGKKLFGKDKFKFKDDSRRQMAITKDEMDKLLHHPVINKSVTHRMRDMFEFSYRCNACNFKDLVNLKWDNIKDGEIIWERAKTKVEIIAAINARMQEIIDTWGDEDSEYIFGLINDKMSAREKQLAVNNTVRLCNDHLKIITKEAGLPKCSTYTVRHTFITLMLEHEPITTVSWLAGHKTTLMVQRYANTPKKEKRKQISEIL
jgi:integrase